MNEFSIRLKKLRMNQGYTQQQLANLLGISKSAISMYESGGREPELSIIQRMADIFEVNIDTLVGTSKDTQEEITTSPFLNIKKLIARNGSKLSDDERNKLIELLSDCEL
ncbi:MAG TPA: XRE family transcriptional regulator [Lachnospiraceae bacterium]|nr:XRE family transcriptional regulator [Lachnospiraceae bacterium]